MSLKGAQEQNDISIIIGNLPKRLQQKIAENCYGATKLATANATTCGEQIVAMAATKSHDAAVVDNDDVKQQQNNCESSISMLPKNNLNEAAMEAEKTKPGILRLQAANALKETAAAKISELPVTFSPARQLSKAATALPAWCELTQAPAIVKELPALHASIIDLLRRNVVLQHWQLFTETRLQLQELFSKLLLQHLKFCCEQKVDTFFWKLLFYNVREQLKQQTPIDLVQQHLLDICKQGQLFYTQLHAQLCSKYLLPTENCSTASKYKFIAKVMAQKLLICLGDLSRYKAKQLQSNDLTEAAAYYQQAQQLIPSNGIPYNQLAIVAIQSRKKLDAIYYHMRSLMSSNAICSARESLLVLFDEIRKKYEETENKRSPINRNNQRHNYQKHNKLNSYDKNMSAQQDNLKSSLRKEIWIHALGARGQLHCNDFRNNGKTDVMKSLKHEQTKYEQMKHEELIRHFINLYLYIIGKLYTGIGMESISEHQRKLCVQFNTLLQRDALVQFSARKRLLKLLALNIFIIEHNKYEETRREKRYHAFLFANQMFGLLLQECNKLLVAEKFSVENIINENSLLHMSNLLQYIYLYSDWLLRNIDVWEPLRKTDHDFNCWQELEEFFAHISCLLSLKNVQSDNSARASFILEEDLFLAGFTPLAHPKERSAISENTEVSTDISQFYTRLWRISRFQASYADNRHLLQLEKLPQEREIEDFKCILQTMSNKQINGVKKSKSASELMCTAGGEDAQKCTQDDSINNKIEATTENLEMLQLSKLKRELEAKTNVKRIYNAKLEEILNYVDTRLYIEVRPKYLMPDTNCFIDSIDDFEALLKEFKCYTLVIPLTVVKELDGLSKGVKIESYEQTLQKDRIHHYDDVSTRAMKSLEFIKNAKYQVKCATTKGSIINASLFALVEEEYVSNDDKILATALSLSKTFSRETSTAGRCFIQTELVLITTDRNLRVKALSRKLAVSDFSEFLVWSKGKK